MTWTAQASSSAVAAAASGTLGMHRTTEWQGWPAHTGRLSQRSTVKVDTEWVALPEAQSPSRLVLPSLEMGL